VTELHAEKPPLPLQIVFLGRQLDRLLERRLSELGLNRTQAMVIFALSRRPGLKALELCPHARVEPANVTRTLQALERLGLLERRSHPTDGRASLFYLTASGHETASSLAAEMETLSAALFESMDQREVDALEQLLSVLRRAVSHRLSANGCQTQDGEPPLPVAEMGSAGASPSRSGARQEENLQYHDRLKVDG
jgi:DNA-binding MarR family transcriptional regulator